ncbi:efflux RND transporter periplasmic adaptor subunit [Alteromonas sp. 1_MG-2023]|uniref:efflux RND transporter periplasmic adaptor subunit n=1 Tax=Alteromonas sp. 1_MG-2023 TaxID=3062669 RepID=UPI0026E2D4C5|nr:efflux RND transporter periplasmic adaptor subunit [Alteromonas sp. 1_MG-2023]MDO6565589.1 efflux RND transporter periplasmic adaptor subunit [Alteromonas sp. 1_MG-2023]
MSKKTLLAAGILTAILSGCSHQEPESHHATMLEFNVTHPIKQDTTLIKEYVSQIRAIQHIEVRAMEKGYLQSTFVDEGQTIEKGQPMFKVMPTIYEAELRKAEAEAEAVYMEYKNTKSLVDQNIVSPNELAVIEAEYQKALAEVELAKAHLAFTDIKAPFTGKMDRLEARTGSLLDEGELLTTLSDLSQMWVYFNVAEAEYLDYVQSGKASKNTKVKLKLANGTVYPYDGVIDAIEADFDNHTGTIEMRASFPNPDSLLRHGQTGNVLVDVNYPGSLIIPQKATFQILDQNYVYIVDKENKLSTRHIEVNAELPHIFLVSDGIEEGDTILIEGLRRVRNGQQIEPHLISANDTLTELELDAE